MFDYEAFQILRIYIVGKPILQAKWSGEKFYHLWNLPKKILLDWPHLETNANYFI
jgi:hypothetical protein